MAEPAYDLADNYPKYGTSKDLAGQRPKLVINVMWFDPKFLDFGDNSGKISPIANVDNIEAELSRWDDIGEIDMLVGGVLKNGIRIPEVPKVKNYLSNFPELIEILPLVCKLAKKKFPPDKAQLSLEVTKDFSGDTEFLILYVRQEQYDENIMEILDDIRSTYGEKLIGKNGWLLVTTDYCPPE